MSKITIPHNECGECFISLAWDDMSRAEHRQYFNLYCSKCPCYLNSIGVDEDSRCLGCGGYTNDGQLCNECRKRISW